MQIGIDGPSGSGKSSVAKALAKRLGFIHIDTGGMYRAVALFARERGADWQDEAQILEILDEIEIDIQHGTDGQRIFLNGQDVTTLVRGAEMGVGASKVSVYPAVREGLVALQRDLAKSRDVVMDGRDIGTVVLPDAQLKIFLTASPQVRARRRCDELAALGQNWDFEEILAQIEKRDFDDSNRAVSPLKKAAGVVEIDASDLDINGVVEIIAEMVRQLEVF